MGGGEAKRMSYVAVCEGHEDEEVGEEREENRNRVWVSRLAAWEEEKELRYRIDEDKWHEWVVKTSWLQAHWTEQDTKIDTSLIGAHGQASPKDQK
jgi:hypothetical protein